MRPFHMTHDSFLWNMCDMSHPHQTRLSHHKAGCIHTWHDSLMWDMTYPSETWLIHVRHGSLLWHATYWLPGTMRSHETWLFHTRHGSFRDRDESLNSENSLNSFYSSRILVTRLWIQIHVARLWIQRIERIERWRFSEFSEFKKRLQRLGAVFEFKFMSLVSEFREFRRGQTQIPRSKFKFKFLLLVSEFREFRRDSSQNSLNSFRNFRDSAWSRKDEDRVA